jgi:hypothetical protein
MRRLALAALVLLASNLPAAGWAQQILSALAADEFVSIRGVSLDDRGAVTGTVENLTEHPLRDVRLRVQCAWHWKNERRPGTDDPSWGAVVAIPEIPPRGEAAFRQEPPRPPPVRSDGEFHVEVTLAGLTVVKGRPSPGGSLP